MSKKPIAIVGILISWCLGWSYSGAQPGGPPSGAAKSFSTNEEFIESLNTNLDLSDAGKVFEYVFFNLASEVTVYPTENYYYFQFPANGKIIKGNIGFFASTIDKEEVNFAFEEVPNFNVSSNPVEGHATLSRKDGVEIRKIAPFRYEVRFRNRSVIFNFNQIEQKMPLSIRLAGDEVFVGQSFDESGLRFLLVFNKTFEHLYWLLNDSERLPESFNDLGKNLLIGKRTAFAFYNDAANNRRILIGVSKAEVEKNSWYDGPFDQLPDNYVSSGEIELKKYIEAGYKTSPGTIDKYGNYLAAPDMRVAIFPYRDYGTTQELQNMLAEAEKSAKNRSSFYCKITKNN